MNARARVVFLAVLTTISLLFAQSAGAIVYGVPDDGAHPYVGAMVVEIDGQQYLWCSGTMLDTGVFLTAAHCYPDEVVVLVGITFDEAFTPGVSTVIPVTNANFIPYGGYDGTPYTDLAVITMPYDPGVGYGTLPEVGLLDTMLPSAQRGKPERSLEAVGYGSSGPNRGTGQGKPELVYPQIKMRSETRIVGLNDANTAGTLVHTTAAPGTGGGTCYGDSGGPFFVAGTNIVVATTITGFNRNCGGGDLNLRMDLQWVQDFILNPWG